MNGLRRILPMLIGLLAVTFATSAGAAQLAPIAPSGAWSTKPIYVASPPNDERVFVAESGRVTDCGKSGGPTTGVAAIRVIKAGSLLPDAYLTLTVSCQGERGLTSFAFAPDFATSGKLYLYASISGQQRVIEYTVPTPSADVATGASTRNVLEMPDNANIHNGGQLTFGPDGGLYVMTGDDNDTTSAQSPASPNGKVLLVNPAGLNAYSIFASGFRNPWRAAFDPAGRLIVADVGQSAREEIDIVGAGGNYGWPFCEGNLPYAGGCAGYAAPFYTYGHDTTHGSIIGGYVARDASLTGITGCYVYGDLKDKNLDMIQLANPGASPQATGLALQNAWSLWSFGEDSSGRLYVMADGTVYRVTAGGSSPAACAAPNPGAAPVAAATFRIATKRLNADRKGRVKIRLTCNSATACHGKVTLRSRSKIRVSGKRRSVVFINTTIKSIPAGTSRTTTFQLRSLGRQALRSHGKVNVRLTARVTQMGSTVTAATRNVTLRR